MINFKLKYLLIILVCFGFVFSCTAFAGMEHSFILRDGNIYQYDSYSCKKIELPFRVDKIFQTRDYLYYLASDKHNESLAIGKLLLTSENYKKEKLLSINCSFSYIRRFIISGGIGYVVCKQSKDDTVSDYFLIIVDIKKSNVDKKEGITDIILVNDSIAVISSEEWGQSINYDGEKLELSTGDDSFFRGILDNRMIFITDSAYTEIIDISQMKSLYFYSLNRECLQKFDYNIHIDIIDTFRKSITDQDRMVFYKIFIDGVEVGRTETGHSEVEKTIKLMVEPGMHHVIKLERWELNAVKNKYERLNNIYQPQEKRLYISSGRVYSISIVNKGREYIWNKKVLCFMHTTILK